MSENTSPSPDTLDTSARPLLDALRRLLVAHRPALREIAYSSLSRGRRDRQTPTRDRTRSQVNVVYDVEFPDAVWVGA
jgi:hypothetical protein